MGKHAGRGSVQCKITSSWDSLPPSQPPILFHTFLFFKLSCLCNTDVMGLTISTDKKNVSDLQNKHALFPKVPLLKTDILECRLNLHPFLRKKKRISGISGKLLAAHHTSWSADAQDPKNSHDTGILSCGLKYKHCGKFDDHLYLNVA